jgi:pimeloyl-ACP methyl ester carboxylesterase
MRRLRLVLSASIIGLLLALGIDVLRKGGVEAWIAKLGDPGPIAGPTYLPLGTTVDVNGTAVYLDCRGAGSPTVILEAGLGSVGAAGGGAEAWGDVLDGVAAFTRVCAWDRPGLGRSAEIGRHSAMDTARLLRTALAVAGDQGPYVVVAHSFGGVYARLFAASGPRAPADGSGADPAAVLHLVMLDTYEPDLGMDLDPALSAETRSMLRGFLDEGCRVFEASEDLDWAATMDELAAVELGTVPTLLLYTDPEGRYTDPDPQLREALIAAWYRAIATRYPTGVLEIVPDAGHFIQLDAPSLVIDRIRSVVLDARAAP